MLMPLLLKAVKQSLDEEATITVSMSYHKEIAAAKKAASLAARLCQAPLSPSLSLYTLTLVYVNLILCKI